MDHFHRSYFRSGIIRLPHGHGTIVQFSVLPSRTKPCRTYSVQLEISSRKPGTTLS